MIHKGYFFAMIKVITHFFYNFTRTNRSIDRLKNLQNQMTHKTKGLTTSMKQRLFFALLSLAMTGSLRAQLEKDASDFYLIGTADELVEFSAMTNDQ